MLQGLPGNLPFEPIRYIALSSRWWPGIQITHERRCYTLTGSSSVGLRAWRAKTSAAHILLGNSFSLSFVRGETAVPAVRVESRSSLAGECNITPDSEKKSQPQHCQATVDWVNPLVFDCPCDVPCCFRHASLHLGRIETIEAKTSCGGNTVCSKEVFAVLQPESVEVSWRAVNQHNRVSTQRREAGLSPRSLGSR